MTQTKNITINGEPFVYTYSDCGLKLERDGVPYSEAYDPAEFNRQYTETDEPIDTDMTETEKKARAYDILAGVSG